MIGELSFLVDLIVNEKLSKTVKSKLVDRIKELEAVRAPLGFVAKQTAYAPVNLPPHIANQSPSTIANFLKSPEAIGASIAVDGSGAAIQAPPPAAAIIASPAAAEAMRSRQQAINAAMSAKPEVGRTSPRKF